MAWSPCALTSANSSWVCALPGAQHWRDLLSSLLLDSLLARGKCQEFLWGSAARNTPQVLQVSRGLWGGMNVLLSAVNIGTGKWIWKHMGDPQDVRLDQHLPQKEIPQLAGHEGRGNHWNGEREPPSAGKHAEWGNLHLQGSCGIEHPFLCYFPAGVRPSGNSLHSAASARRDLSIPYFCVQAGECMKFAQVLPKALNLLLLHCLAQFAKLYSHLNLHKNSHRVPQIMWVYPVLIWKCLILLFYNAMTSALQVPGGKTKVFVFTWSEF